MINRARGKYMSQGHPQGSYGQAPPGYGQQQPNPYGQQPYGGPQYAQPYPPQAQQPYPHPYPPQPYPAQAQPYAAQPHPRQPYPQTGSPLPPRKPQEAGDLRRMTGAVVDSAIAVVAAFAAAKHSPQAYFTTLFGVLVGVSFLNHVVLARIAGCSLGKFLMATRVIRFKDVTRPHTWRLTKRWLLGWVILPVGLLLDDDVEPEEACGVRIVRRKDLNDWKQLTGRLG
ncbi:RDD family protein [Kitasatospora sp. NPDC050543]|uniref:RDD family protein n=1 Tax=Kitasatospora sp. NPDC050543 TaxID=3364054 RepID=UPI0037B54A7B